MNFEASPALSHKSPKDGRDPSLNKRPLDAAATISAANRIYQPNAKVSLNDMFRPKNTTGMISLGMLANNHAHLGNLTGGPKLFIKQ